MNLFNSILGPGSSGCELYGNVTDVCTNLSILPITSFSKVCSSFFYDGIQVGKNYCMDFKYSDDDKSNKKINRS